MTEKMWGYEIKIKNTSGVKTVMVNHSNGCVNIHDEVMNIVKHNLNTGNEIIIRWEGH